MLLSSHGTKATQGTSLGDDQGAQNQLVVLQRLLQSPMQEVVMKFKKQLLKAAMCGAALSLISGVGMAQESIVSQQLIVGWKQQPGQLGFAGASANAAAALAEAGDRHGVSLRGLRMIATGGQVVRISNDVTPSQMQDMIATLAANPMVEYVEEDKLLTTQFVPNDPMYAQQWHYFEAAGGLNLQPAWDITRGAGSVVAVIDTGFRPHADLAANLLPGYDFISSAAIGNDGNGRDNNAIDTGDFAPAGACGAGSRASNSSWHGTHVSGTVAAVTNNGRGVAGVAFAAKVVPVRALGRCGGNTSDIADAMIWASGGAVAGIPNNANPARVLNLSLGGGGPCGATTSRAINSARARGTVVVVAAGNSNASVNNATPANCPGVVAVAATGRRGERSSFTNTGTLVDVAAPGGNQVTGQANGVLSTLNAGRTVPGADSFAFYQGTSMATPHVAGVVALMQSVNRALTPTQIETMLRNTTRRFPSACAGCGTGIVNATAAVNAARGQ